MAAWKRSRSNSMRLSLLFGMTRSYAGNCPSIIRDTRSRPSIRKKMWLSSFAKRMSPSPSVSRRPSSDSVFFGRIVRVSSTFGSPSRGAVTTARRWPSVATSIIASWRTHEERAVQEVPRVLAGDGELRLHHHLAQERAVDRHAVARARGPAASGSRPSAASGSAHSNRSAATFTAPFLSSSMRMSVSGSSFTISKSFFAGSVSAPALAIDAVHSRAQAHLEVRGGQAHWSRPWPRCSTFARIGIVFLRSTMPWNSCEFFEQIEFADDEFHGVLPPGPAAVDASGSDPDQKKKSDQEIILKGSCC